MTSINPQPFQPDCGRREFYEQLYQKVYRNLFPALQSSLDMLADLTGLSSGE
jgi:hypothetical protein